MGLDPSLNNNAAAIAATIAASLNYGQNGLTGLSNSSSNQSQNKPRPPALARVSCHICRKELCNKYFLKSHLLNAHHITADDFLINSLVEAQSKEKLIKNELFDFSKKMGGSLDKQPLSPTASMRSNSSGYNGGHNLRNKNMRQASTKNEEDEIEEGQQVDEGNNMNSENDEEEQDTAAALMKQNLMSFNALLNYNKMMNGDNSSSSQAAAAAAAALMASSDGENSGSFGTSCNMQPFLFECQEESFNTNFVPCMVYLPVKSKLGSSITIKVTLKPLDASASAGNINGSVSGSANEENEEVEENFENC